MRIYILIYITLDDNYSLFSCAKVYIFDNYSLPCPIIIINHGEDELSEYLLYIVILIIYSEYYSYLLTFMLIYDIGLIYYHLALFLPALLSPKLILSPLAAPRIPFYI